jgi:4-hydroxy-tetrahydrodipicolinate synthase
MSAPVQRFGLSCALTTPFLLDGSVDLPRLTAHVRSRLAAGCASVTLCGTTGEGASLGRESRERMLAAVREDGVNLEREVVFGIAASSAEEAKAQARQAAMFGCRTVLLPPPFYFKDATEEGLLSWFSRVLEHLAGDGLRAILYHIPSVTAVPLSLGLIGRLRERFSGTLLGVKDSSGDWDYARRLLARHGDLTILIGDERRLAEAVRIGASGAISGLANVVPELMLPLANEGRDDPRISALVEEVLKYSVTPAVKELVAHRTCDPAWRTVAPPLSALTREDAQRLTAAFDSIVQQARGEDPELLRHGA